jgi:hypothetical protein
MILLWTAVCCVLALYAALRWGSSRAHQRLARVQAGFSSRYERFRIAPTVQPPTIPACAHLRAIPQCLDAATFDRVRSAAEHLAAGERSYIPGHKAGATVSYAALHRLAPELVAFYQSEDLRRLCSLVCGVEVQPTPVHDQSSCSLLVYERAGDRIGWHFDHDFYRGRHFTVLLALVNRRAQGDGTSSAQLEARLPGGNQVIPTPPNTVVIFEGARVRHRVTPLGPDEQRILLSMTFCTDPRSTVLQGLVRRMKDTAYFGIKALWS